MSNPTKQATVRVIRVGSLDQHTYIPPLLLEALWAEIQRQQALIDRQEALLAALATELETIYDTLDCGARALMAEAADATEAAVYDDLTHQEQQAIAQQAPAHFADDAAAITWGLEQGAFQALQHARNAHTKLKRQHAGLPNDDLARMWVDDVDARLAELTPEQVAENLAAIEAGASEAAPEQATQNLAVIETEASEAAPEQAGNHPQMEVPPEEPGAAPEQDTLNEFFPREEQDTQPVAASPPAAPAPTSKKTVQTPNDFWHEFYSFKNQGRLPQAEQLRSAPQINTALKTGDWNEAHKWLLTQVRR